MSIDGKWIKKNEVREFKEITYPKNDIEQLRQEVKEKYCHINSIFDNISFYLNLDTDDTFFPDDSIEIKNLKSLTSLYNSCCDFDLNNIESMKSSIKGFDWLSKETTVLLNKMKTKMYPRNDITSLSRQLKDRAKYLETLSEQIKSNDINNVNVSSEFHEEVQNISRKSK